jgi:hypothetical protein
MERGDCRAGNGNKSSEKKLPGKIAIPENIRTGHTGLCQKILCTG